MRLTPFVYIITFISINAYAQGTQISGVLQNAKNEAIADVVVQLFNESETSIPLKSTISDVSGRFVFEDVPAGKYILETSHLGHELFFREVTTIEGESVNLGTIILEEKSEELDAIVISGKKLPVTQTVDKVTINVAGNILGAGGTAVDILKQLPIVTVSSEGTVSIRGKSDVQILINGKPSGVVAAQGQNYLDQLDLNTVERIEVITNPSVIKTATASGGVINIITKKNTKKGVNGIIAAGFGTDEWYHFSPGFSYGFETVNLFMNYTLRHRKRISENSSFREQELLGIQETIDQNQTGIREDLRHNIELGLDYYISVNQYFTFSGYYVGRDKQDKQNRQTTQRVSSDIIETRDGLIQEPEKNEGYGAYANFTSVIDDDNRLNVLFDYTHSVEDEDIFREEEVISGGNTFVEGIQTFYVDTNDRYMLDFEREITKEERKITYGAQAVYRKINQTFNALEFDEATNNYVQIDGLTDVFDYQDFVGATYAQLENEAGKFSYELAIRFELLNNSYRSRSIDRSFSDDYFKFFPSVKASYEITDNTLAQLSFKKGVNRPAPSRLNPFPDISNAFNVSIGNPNLAPEVFHNTELGITQKFSKASLNAGFFFTLYDDLIQRVTELRDDGLTYRFPINVNKMYHFGIDINAQITLTNWWNQSMGGLAFKRTFEDDFIESSEKFSFQAKTTSNITLQDNLELQLLGSYNAPDNTPQGEIDAQYFVDIGIEYELLQKKLKMVLSATDIFNTLDENTFLRNEGLASRSRQKINTRRIYFTTRYTF